jgi:hypothetical protein
MPIKRTRRKICPFCKNSFPPNYRHGDRQKACRREQCQRQRHARATAAWKKKTPNYHRQHYQDYVKPWRERQRALQTKQSTTVTRTPQPVSVQDHQSFASVVLMPQLCAQITACISQGFDRLEQRLRQAV